MSEHSEKTVFNIQRAAESDWSWIAEGQTEIVWARMDRERQGEEDLRSVRLQVAQQIAHLRQEEGFPNEAFVAKTDGGTLAGFVWIAKTHNDSTGQLEASLLSQYVAAPYRDQGLGRRLMETAEDWARGQHLPRISLSVGSQNALAQGLYESLGYEVETLRMTKQLGLPEAKD